MNLLKKLSVVTAGVAFSVLGSVSAAQALTFVGSYNGNSYYSTDNFSDWDSAQAEAVSISGNLVTINDAAEQNFLVSAFGGIENFWIGFNDVASEGTF